MATRRSIFKISLSSLVAIALVFYLWTLSTERVTDEFLPEQSAIAAKPVPDFTDFDNVTDKKRAFFNYLRPEIEDQNQHLLGIRHQLLAIKRKIVNRQSLSTRELDQLSWLATEYRVRKSVCGKL